MIAQRTLAAAVLGVFVASSHLAAQWIRNPAPSAPRKADGSVDMSAPTPRTADGKPDLSGIWTSDEIDPRRPNVPPNPRDATTSRRMVNLGVELPGGLPYQPWLAALVKQRWAVNAKDDPHVKCFPDNFIRAYGMPHLLKFAQMPGLLIVLNEWNAVYRQVFTDGRPLPNNDPQPWYFGYSVGHWDGDSLVVETTGLRDDGWLDVNGTPLTSAAKVTERFRRPVFGTMTVDITIDDPKAYTKPWSVSIEHRIMLNTDLMEFVCQENEKSSQHF